MKGIRIALISILAGIIIGLMAILILAINGRWSWSNLNTEYGSGWSLFGGSYTSTLQNTTTIDVSDMEKLKIDYIKSPFDVIFLPADGNELIVEEYFSRETLREKMAEIKQSGDTVTIKQQYFTGVSIGFINNINGYIKVYLPTDAYASLKELSVSCTSGDISLPAWEGIGEGEYRLESAKLETVSGDMRIDYLEAEKIKLSSTSGDIISGKLTGEITATTVSGEQKAEEIWGNMSATSTSGDIRIIDARLENAKLETVSGDMEIDYLEAEKITLSSTSGDIISGKLTGEITATTVGGEQKAEGIRGNMSATSTSGDIRISNVTGDLNLGSTSGDLQADSLSGKGSFSTSSGDITAALEKWQGDIHAKSISGDVKINLPGEDSFHFKADSISGSIETPYDKQLNFNKRGTTADGTIGNNAVYRIEISTTSGDITLRGN